MKNLKNYLVILLFGCSFGCSEGSDKSKSAKQKPYQDCSDYKYHKKMFVVATFGFKHIRSESQTAWVCLDTNLDGKQDVEEYYRGREYLNPGDTVMSVYSPRCEDQIGELYKLNQIKK